MASFVSYSRIEKTFSHDFRNKINMARNTNEIYDAFCYTVASMLNHILDEKRFDVSDIEFFPDQHKHYALSNRVTQDDRLAESLEFSDLKRILWDMAMTATHHHDHLARHPEKTNLSVTRH